jgi:hypothetical protein
MTSNHLELELDIIALAGALSREGDALKRLCEKLLDLPFDKTKGGFKRADVGGCRVILGQVKEMQDAIAKQVQRVESSLKTREQKT